MVIATGRIGEGKGVKPEQVSGPFLSHLPFAPRAGCAICFLSSRQPLISERMIVVGELSRGWPSQRGKSDERLHGKPSFRRAGKTRRLRQCPQPDDLPPDAHAGAEDRGGDRRPRAAPRATAPGEATPGPKAVDARLARAVAPLSAQRRDRRRGAGP